MSLLLHLSDLHLANTSSEDAIGDYKIEAVPEGNRITRIKLLRSTLGALSRWLVANGETLDGIVITGDVTTRGQPEGFAQLPVLLDALGETLPAPGRVVVVPGNHDVTWKTQPGSAERYQAYLKGVREAGYVTPLLEGVDNGKLRARSVPGPLLTGSDFVVAAINSADMCGVQEPFPVSSLEEELLRLVSNDDISEGLRTYIERLRTYDMPRISDEQMTAVKELLDDLPAGLVRIAALHHQLVPVREEEEVKPFESIVNVAAFSAFLGDNGVDLIAHGHKHADHVQMVTLGGPSGSTGRQAVVSSCGTVGGTVGLGHEIAKLIRIESGLARLSHLEILTGPKTA